MTIKNINKLLPNETYYIPMKIKKGFELRDICGEKVIMATGIENVDFNQLISLNETAAYLWSNIQDKLFNKETLATLLCDEYEVSREQALVDAENIIGQWFDQGIIEN